MVGCVHHKNALIARVISWEHFNAFFVVVVVVVVASFVHTPFRLWNIGVVYNWLYVAHIVCSIGVVIRPYSHMRLI